jgi:hypothetical protein
MESRRSGKVLSSMLSGKLSRRSEGRPVHVVLRWRDFPLCKRRSAQPSGRNQTDDSPRRASLRDCFVAALLAMTVILTGHCEPPGPRSARPEDRLREAISVAAGPVRNVWFAPLVTSYAACTKQATFGLPFFGSARRSNDAHFQSCRHAKWFPPSLFPEDRRSIPPTPKFTRRWQGRAPQS